METWNVGDKAIHFSVKCTVVAINAHSSAIQYSRTGELATVPLTSLRPDFSDEDRKSIEDIFQIIYAEDDYRSAAESLYLSGYRKTDIDNPADWGIGDWVECIEEPDTYVTLGKTYQIEGFSDYTRFFSLRDDEGDIGTYSCESFKFHKAGELK